MKTEKEMKIKVLKDEIEIAKAKIEKYHCEMEHLVEEITKKEFNSEAREEELAELKAKSLAIKDLIPDFSEQTCELYMQYLDSKKEYENTSQFYDKIEAQLQGRKERVEEIHSYIESLDKRICCLHAAIEKEESEKV